MTSLPLWRYEVRRVGWAALLTPPLAAAVVAGFALVDRSPGADERSASGNLFAALEMALPLVTGIGAASLVGRDPTVELQLTLPTRYRTTLLRRLAVLLGWTGLVALAIAAYLIGTGWPWTHGTVVGQLIWLAPTLWLAAVGLLAGAVLRSPAAAGGLVAVLWLVEQLFRATFQEHAWSRLLYLFATTRGAVPGDWMANRLTLVGTALALGVAAWALLGRTERLVGGEVE